MKHDMIFASSGHTILQALHRQLRKCQKECICNCINKELLYSGSNNVDHIKEEVLNNLEGLIKMIAHFILNELSEKKF
jgi:hypothetical protein